MLDALRKIFGTFSRTEKSVFLASLVAFVVSGVLLLGAVIEASTIVVPARGGEFVEGIVGQPSYVNPVLAASDVDRALVRLLYSPLDELADKIESDKVGRTWTVRLKENIFWTDGKKLTSDDVIFTVERIQDPESGSPAFSSWQGVSVNRLSELELEFHLVAPYPFFPYVLQSLYALPKHLFASIPASNWRLSDFNLKPVGSGPYMFDSYEKEANGFIHIYRLKASNRYFKRSPYLESYMFRFFSGAKEMGEAFNAGIIDGFADPKFEEFRSVMRPHQVFSYFLPTYYSVFFNQSQNLAFKEAAVRQALSRAADRETLVRDVFDGYAVPLEWPLPRRASPGLGAAPMPPLEDAAKLLDDSGWTRGEDGFRAKTVKNTKVELAFTLVAPRLAFLEKTAEALKGSWEALGARVDLLLFSPDEVVDRVIKNREYHALLFGNVLTPSLDLYSFWHSNERFSPGLNLALYSNKKAPNIQRMSRQ